MKTYFVTGATGVVGSELIARLNAAGHFVIAMVRSLENEDGRIRLRQLLDRVGPMIDHKRIVTVEGDITLPNCGVDKWDIVNARKHKVDVFIHLAANVKMAEAERENILAANVGGTANALELCRDINCRSFQYVSTAYVANGQSNAYEEAKSLAEQLVIDAAADERRGLKYTISRISIVVGRSTDAFITGFTGYYGFFKPFVRIANEIRSKAGLASDSLVDMNVSIKVADGAILNIIPLDWAAEMLRLVSERPCENKTLNIVHPEPPETREVINGTLSALNIGGVTIGHENAATDIDSMAQRTYTFVMHVFEPYVGKTISFDDSDLRRFLGGAYYPPPTYRPETFAKLIGFAVKKNFGWRKE